jgi:hypothetical protein
VAIVFALTRPVAPRGVSVFTGGDPLPESNALGAEDFSEFAEQAFRPALHTLDPDPVYTGVWRGLVGLARPLGALAAGVEQRPLAPVLIAAALVVLLVWLI